MEGAEVETAKVTDGAPMTAAGLIEHHWMALATALHLGGLAKSVDPSRLVIRPSKGSIYHEATSVRRLVVSSGAGRYWGVHAGKALDRSGANGRQVLTVALW